MRTDKGTGIAAIVKKIGGTNQRIGRTPLPKTIPSDIFLPDFLFLKKTFTYTHGKWPVRLGTKARQTCNFRFTGRVRKWCAAFPCAPLSFWYA